MTHTRRVAALSMALAVLTAVPGVAATTNVAVRDNFFDQATVTVAVGDTVTWGNASGGNSHSVRQNRRLFRSGSPASAFTLSRIFSAGVYLYFCEVHGFPGGGMNGTVRVPVTIAPGPTGLPFTVRWASALSNTGDVFDVQFRIGKRTWRTWRTDTTSLQGVFGKSGKPVQVQQGTTYSFRARTQFDASTPLRVSGWSPVRSFTAN